MASIADLSDEIGGAAMVAAGVSIGALVGGKLGAAVGGAAGTALAFIVGRARSDAYLNKTSGPAPKRKQQSK